jgi:hypothetical protein
MEEVFIFSIRSRSVNEVSGKIIICNFCRMLGDEILQGCRPFKCDFLVGIMDIQVINQKITVRIDF